MILPTIFFIASQIILTHFSAVLFELLDQ